MHGALKFSLLAKSLALLVVAITFSSRMTVACVMVWDSARPSKACRWQEEGEARRLGNLPVPRGKTREREKDKQLQLQLILVL